MFDISVEVLTAGMIIGLLLGIATGHYLAFVLGGVSIIFGVIGWGPECLPMLVNRLFGSVLENYVLMAVPLFILMAMFLERSGIMGDLFNVVRYLLGPINGGVAVAVILVSTIFGACTGIVGASVVTMGILALPVMLSYGYDKKLSCGVVSSGGTLGQIVPPSIMLIFMATQTALPVGKLFAAAIIPAILLSFLYCCYILVKCYLNKEAGPAISAEEKEMITGPKLLKMVMKTLVPPTILIFGVLGSIFAGLATPTEAAGIGALLSVILIIAYGRFSWSSLKDSVLGTAKLTSMAMFIVVGANCFTGVFLGVGGGDVVQEFILALGLGKWGVFAVIVIVLFVMGMFIDWIGIVLITFPIFIPIVKELGIDVLWFVTMTALVLQSSFLTPPFGYSLFFLKGVAPKEITMNHIYVGIIPFCAAIFIAILVCAICPQIVTWLPAVLVK
ncbi:MAG: TRAP transporter large permease subunit [Thermodesulfobacteriota bacterium]|nr:TRAP transporter large permease subunit [Thermodesulfobacteriota bacterium]